MENKYLAAYEKYSKKEKHDRKDRFTSHAGEFHLLDKNGVDVTAKFINVPENFKPLN